MDDISQLTTDHVDALKKFEEATKDLDLPQTNKTYIIRWLIARDFDQDKALDMLKAHIEWRKRFKADDLQDSWEPHSITKSYIPLGFLGDDKNDNPTWILMLGNMDIRGVLKSVPHQDMLEYCAWVLERSMRIIAKHAEKNQNRLHRLNILVDLANWKLADLTSLLTLNFARDLALMYEANYPEILGKLIIFNAPVIFNVLFNFVKPFLSELTIQKIRILGGDKSVWQKELEAIPPEKVPKKWGGKLTDPDGNEYALRELNMNMGEKVPPSNYLSNQSTETFQDVDGIKT